MKMETGIMERIVNKKGLIKDIKNVFGIIIQCHKLKRLLKKMDAISLVSTERYTNI